MQDEIPSSFANELRTMSKGAVDAELTEALQQVVKAVLETGKAGKFGIEFVVKLEKGYENHVKLSPVISAKPPRFDTPGQPFYAYNDGTISRDDPEQAELNFRTVPNDDVKAIGGSE